MNRYPLTNRKAWPVLAVIPILFGILDLGTCMKAYGESKDIEMVVHGLSVHFNSHLSENQNWNGRNPGVGIRLPLNQKSSLALQGGTYKNSYALTTFYAGIDWLPIQRGFLAFGAGLGAATGYPIFNGMPIPIGGLVVQWKTSERVSMRFRVLPPVVPKSAGAASLEFSWRFHKKSPVER